MSRLLHCSSKSSTDSEHYDKFVETATEGGTAAAGHVGAVLRLHQRACIVVGEGLVARTRRRGGAVGSGTKRQRLVAGGRRSRCRAHGFKDHRDEDLRAVAQERVELGHHPPHQQVGRRHVLQLMLRRAEMRCLLVENYSNSSQFLFMRLHEIIAIFRSVQLVGRNYCFSCLCQRLLGLN